LKDSDTVVVAAFVPWFYAMNPKSARKTNKSIVRNAVKHAEDDANIIYFSTLVAFGSQVGLSNWNWYGREKRRTENDFNNYCEKYNKNGHILRLGHVYGPTQDHTREFMNDISGHDKLYFPVSDEKKTNIIHISALCDAVSACSDGNIDPGTYGVVNQPQWSWKDAVERYGSNTTVQFRPDLTVENQGGNVVQRLAGFGVRMFRPYKEVLISPLHYVPDRISSYLNTTRNSEEVSESLGKYNDRLVYKNSHLEYDPMPDPLLDITLENINSDEEILKDHLLR